MQPRFPSFLMPHSVRQTVFLVLSIGFLLLTGAQYYVTGGLFSGQLLKVESADAFGQLARLRGATALLEEDLKGTTEDWAQWDDSYEFVSGQGADYVASNLNAETFRSLRLSLVIIVDDHGRALYAKSWAGPGTEPEAAPADIVALATGQGRLGAGPAKQSGFIATSAGIMLVSSYSVRDSAISQPGKGRFIMGRSLQSILPSLNRLTPGSLVIEPLQGNREHVPGNLEVESMQTDGRDALFLSSGRIDAHTPLDDLWHRPIATMHVQMDRPLRATLANSRIYLLLSSLLTGIAACGAAVMVLQSRLVAPIEKMALSVTAIGNEGSVQRRVEEHYGTTELMTLGRSINSMLGQIEAQSNLRTDRDAAVEANRLKSEFLAIMSHEIRTPMNGVLGMCELLQRTELNARQRHLSDTLLRSARSLLGILNDILDFSKIESGKLQLESAVFSPSELLAGMSAPFIAAAHAKGVELTTHSNVNVPGLVIGDALRLRQVLNNLVGNAVKFTASGAITITCAAEDQTLEHTYLRFTVTDTGVGIAPEAQTVVFDAFAQAESKTTRQFGGTGLGLAIVRRLVELMDGKLGLHSEPGVGSRFWFTVRLQRAAAKSLPAPRVETEIATGMLLSLSTAPAVLLAEDHAVNREVLTEMLEVFGSKVTAVENGVLALAAASSAAFDIVLMDCQMPVMDGQTATAQLRALEHTTGKRRTFIVALTADATLANKMRCYDAGVDLVATKPISQSRLRELVMLALQARTKSEAPGYVTAS